MAAVTTRATWVDLLDPTADEVRAALPSPIHPAALDTLLRSPQHDDDPRPRLRAEGDYVFGVIVVPVCVNDEDRVFYEEVDLVLTHGFVLTVRKTPPGDPPFDIEPVRQRVASCHSGLAGMVAFHLIDEVAERYLDLTDALHAEIDELEDNVERLPSEHVRSRLSSLRHDLLRIRRTLSPQRDALRGVVDNRVEIAGEELFPRDVELHFAEALETLLRAGEALDFSRDLLSSVRDYHQAKVANQQNEVMQRLTVVASLLLVPTFIVGVYGQNFEHMPELHWFEGYAGSWALIVVSTVAQLIFFRRKGWI